MRNEGLEREIQAARSFMLCDLQELAETDQMKKLEQPPLAKAAGDSEKIQLTMDFAAAIKNDSYSEILVQRESVRTYTAEALTLTQLAFLLYSTQGVKEIKGNNYATLRTVPSGGARHPFETYIAALNVEGLQQGIYRYLPLEHQLEFLRPVESLADAVTDSLCSQAWAAKSAAVFYYTCVAYRGEWRYSTSAHRVMLMDVGHVVQNLYLSATAIGGGACAIAALLPKETDELLGVDSTEEFSIYACPVGLV